MRKKIIGALKIASLTTQWLMMAILFSGCSTSLEDPAVCGDCAPWTYQDINTRWRTAPRDEDVDAWWWFPPYGDDWSLFTFPDYSIHEVISFESSQIAYPADVDFIPVTLSLPTLETDYQYQLSGVSGIAPIFVVKQIGDEWRRVPLYWESRFLMLGMFGMNVTGNPPGPHRYRLFNGMYDEHNPPFDLIRGEVFFTFQPGTYRVVTTEVVLARMGWPIAIGREVIWSGQIWTEFVITCPCSCP